MILTPKKFSQFKDWNIDMILFSKDLSSTYSMMKLEKIIVPRKEKIKPADINFEKGAFAVNEWGDIYASTDYTSYIIDTNLRYSIVMMFIHMHLIL